jgi:hypothetical protein
MSALTLSANVNNNIAGVAFNDMYLDNQGNISLSTDLQAVLEECAQAARTLLGECIFDTTIGIPYQQVLWIGVPNIQQWIAALRQAFLAVSGVTEVISIVAEQQTNTVISSQSADMLVFTAIIQTIYGTGTIQ